MNGRAMSIEVTDDIMTGFTSGATARRTSEGLYIVSWLGDRLVTRNAAITALTLAEEITNKPEPGSMRWLFIDGWAGELGLTRDQAVNAIESAARRTPFDYRRSPYSVAAMRHLTDAISALISGTDPIPSVDAALTALKIEAGEAEPDPDLLDTDI